MRQETGLCDIEILGALRVTCAGLTRTQFGSHKTAAVLVWLALHPGPQPRERVIDLFWPEMELNAGRNNLSTTLVSVRRLLEPPGVRRGDVLAATHHEVGLNPEAITTDATRFESLLKQASRADTREKRITLLRRAMELHRGEILAGSYYDWALRATERFQSLLQTVLEQLSRDLEAESDFAGALETVQRGLAIDPYSETFHCRLVKLLCLTGRTGTAREAHQRFERLFAEEFGASPSRETQQTAARLLAAVPVQRDESDEPLVQTPPRPASASRYPESLASADSLPRTFLLPVLLSRFFGRDEELREMARLLLPAKGLPTGPDPPELPGRLVTLIGPGGIGKTRLAIEFARLVAARSTAWCGFVSLAELTDVTQAERQVAETLRAGYDSTQSPLEAICAFLQQQDRPEAPPLLIIDNLEHLLPGIAMEKPVAGDYLPEFIGRLLERTPGLRIVCTSRRRIGLRGERLIPVTPLPVPDALETETDEDHLAAMYAVPAVRLYVDRAQAVRPDFALTPTNARAVASLCRQLEGSPLAVELAAAWVRVLPPRKMWERLTQGLDIPAGSYTDLPARHRTLTAALDWSYRLLSAPLQRLLACLSVFRGGWTQEAVEDICEEPAAFSQLAELHEASLVVTSEDTEGQVRWTFLETVRIFSAQQLEVSGETERLRRRHALYFRGLAEEAAKHQRGAQQAAWLARLEAEKENMRAVMAWWEARSDEAEANEFGLHLALGLHRFWFVRGYWQEGLSFVEKVLAKLRSDAPTRLHAKLLGSAAGLHSALGALQTAQRHNEEALTILRALNDRRGIGDALHNLGLMALTQGDLDRAQGLYTESLEIQRELNDNLGIADELHHLGMVAHERGNLDTAQPLYEESLALRKPFGDLRGIAFSLQNLANIAFSLGKYQDAFRICEENLAIRIELGDRKGIGDAHHNMGVYAHGSGDRERAQTYLQQALGLRYELNDWTGAAESLDTFANLFLDLQEYVRAARLHLAAEAIRTKIGATLTPYEQTMHGPLIAQLQEKLSKEELAALESRAGPDHWEQIIKELISA